jgi:hypothetical protein
VGDILLCLSGENEFSGHAGYGPSATFRRVPIPDLIQEAPLRSQAKTPRSSSRATILSTQTSTES